MRPFALSRLTALLLLACFARTQAEVKLPSIFSNHMVLQQNIKLPVWGTAAPGEEITVLIAGQEVKTKAGNEGQWKVTLAPLTASDQAVQMTVSGTNKLTFDDVLIGDVWICSGQSNMDFGLRAAHNASLELPKANHPTLRFFLLKKTPSITPQTDCVGEWRVCDPASVSSFSAVGYFFGREIMETQKIPVGLVQSSWGGTIAQSWTSIEALGTSPALANSVNQYKNLAANVTALKEKFETEDLPKWKTAHDEWVQKVQPGYQEQLKQWQKNMAEAKKNGQPVPPMPPPSTPEPKAPLDPTQNPNISSVLFNGMIAPLLPYGIKGAIWYQGESNAGDEQGSKLYATLFPLMITDWRQRWGEGDFPFLFVQLASYGPGRAYPFLRNSQLKTLSLPNTGMAVTIDIGEEKDIHPKNKYDVGHRLAIAARGTVYGEKITYSGPIYTSSKTDGNKMILSFNHTGSGLTISSAPPIRLDQPAAAPLNQLEGFEIAGSDKKFIPAQAKIEGETVVVWSDQIAQPTAVRYAWSAFPTANLYNKDGLPASPFATDMP
jgi:sialate O-acetylesterase